MKFENLLNPINSKVTKLDLSEKEMAYIAMIISNTEKNKVVELLSLKEDDINSLYKKFGLTDNKFDKNAQLITIVNLNGIINENILYDVYKKYNVQECKELMKLKRKAPKRSEKYKREANEVLASFMDTIKERTE